VLFRTRAGEVTLRVSAFTMLAKAIAPLPAPKAEVVDGERVVHSPFANPEARYRERYADLAVNPEVREIFRKRSAVVRALQRFLDGRGFIEVETPILQPIYGGAAAQPHHHNQLHQDCIPDLFELYSSACSRGLERYEIGRDFRSDLLQEQPEFTCRFLHGLRRLRRRDGVDRGDGCRRRRRGEWVDGDRL
jgi:lysyl-tRNA synthetase class 2